MTAHAMAGEWPADFNWRSARGGHRQHGRGRSGRAGRTDMVWRVLEARSQGPGRGLPDPDELERFAALRHVRGGGPFGPGGGPFGPGGGRGPRRRKRGDVRQALLMLLSEEPMNGYQLMQTIEERSRGEWRPSPGSVYPSLAQLEDEGLVRATERDGQRLFEITDAGREQVAGRPGDKAPWDLESDAGSNPRRQIRSAIGATAAAAMQVAHVGGTHQVARAIEVLDEARRGLYRILAEDDGGLEDDHE